MGDKSQLGGAYHGSERIADVGGRGLVVGFVFAVKLVVVGDEPVVFLGNHPVEEMPCVLGNLAHLGVFLFGKTVFVVGEFLSQPIHQERRKAPCRTGEGHSNEDNHAGSIQTVVVEHKAGNYGQCYGTYVVEPEFADIVAQGAFGALGGLVAGNPVKQILVAEHHTIAGPYQSVGVHPRLLGKQGKLHYGTVQYHTETAHQRGVVAITLIETRQGGNLSDDEKDDGTGHYDECHQQVPRWGDNFRRGGDKCRKAESRHYHHHNAEAQHRTAQVVENLPAAYGINLILNTFAFLVFDFSFEPAYYLPVAAGPAVVAFGVVDVVGGVVVEQLEVVDKSATYVAAFDKVVAEDEVFGESAFQHLLEHFKVVNTFATERSFVENILIKLETGGGIDIQSAQSGE